MNFKQCLLTLAVSCSHWGIFKNPNAKWIFQLFYFAGQDPGISVSLNSLVFFCTDKCDSYSCKEKHTGRTVTEDDTTLEHDLWRVNRILSGKWKNGTSWRQLGVSKGTGIWKCIKWASSRTGQPRAEHLWEEGCIAHCLVRAGESMLCCACLANMCHNPHGLMLKLTNSWTQHFQNGILS